MYIVAIKLLTRTPKAALAGHLLWIKHIAIQSTPGGRAETIKKSLYISEPYTWKIYLSSTISIMYNNGDIMILDDKKTAINL